MSTISEEGVCPPNGIERVLPWLLQVLAALLSAWEEDIRSDANEPPTEDADEPLLADANEPLPVDAWLGTSDGNCCGSGE